MCLPDDEATTKAKHPVADFWRLALCYDGAKSREEARALMKGAYYSAYERARKDPRMVQALRYIGELYADYYGWVDPESAETRASK